MTAGPQGSERADLRLTHMSSMVEPTKSNELMVSALQEATGLPCFAFEDLARVKPALKAAGKSECLVLYDCQGKEGKASLADLQRHDIAEGLMPVLFNLEKRNGLEIEALSYGVRGFFYVGEPFSLLVKGVAWIFEGQYWISRLLFSEVISHSKVISHGCRLPGRMKRRLLSKREEEILRVMAGGATTKEIADAMFISGHTVKNHLQKIFRKIDVHSRIHAVHWAARHLQH